MNTREVLENPIPVELALQRCRPRVVCRGNANEDGVGEMCGVRENEKAGEGEIGAGLPV